MNAQQFEQWKDFAFRMAETCYAKNRRPNVHWIVAMLEEFLDDGGYGGYFDADTLFTINSWDQQSHYEDQRRENHLSWCGCQGRRMDGPGPFGDCPDCHGSGLHYALQRGPCLTDLVSDYLDPYIPSPRCKHCAHDCANDPCPLCESDCSCDDIQTRVLEQWDDQWGGPIHCCLRAGIDLICNPSPIGMGVLGFTAGDLRRMYPEGVPEFVSKGNERWYEGWPGKEVLNGTFAEMADDTVLML